MNIWQNLTNDSLKSDYWTQELWGNTVYDYAYAFLLLIIFLVSLKLFQLYLLGHLRKLAKRTETDLDDTAITIVDSLRPGIYSVVAIYLATRFLVLSNIVNQAITIIVVIALVYQTIAAVQILINYVVKKQMSDTEEESTRSMIGLISLATKVLLWSMGVLFVLSNLGVNVMSLVTGMGIGGIAVALALQNILGDLFSSLAIFFDKPFRVGDFISVGDGTAKGTVEKIGIKTTRLRSQQGEELVISNQELTSARIWNYKNMQERRISSSIGVTYETPTKLVAQIPDMIKNIITKVKNARFDRAYFTKFNDSALGIDIVYFVESTDYVIYLEAQQEINLKIKEFFEEKDIEMAYPTQTVFLQKSAKI